jgi:hypothetical protein
MSAVSIPSHDLNYIQLRELSERAVALKFLRADTMPLMAGFLYQQFRKPGQNRIAEPSLRLALSQHLDQLSMKGFELPEGMNAKSYIDQWVDKNYLGRFFLADGETEVIELKSETIRAMDFLQRLERASFVGAESKMKSIFDSLKTLAVQTNTDPEVRIDDLTKQREQIDREIQRIRTEGRAEILSSTQVKERLARLDDDLSGLFGDFREITENFHAIGRNVHRQAIESEKNRGELLGEAIDANQSLAESDQGKSFQGFMGYLQSHELRTEALTYMERIQDLPEAALVFKERYGNEAFSLRKRFHGLSGPAQQVVQATSFLIERVRGAVSTSKIQEGKALEVVLNEIKAALMNEPLKPGRSEPFFSIEDRCDVFLPLERPFWSPQKIVRLKSQPSNDNSVTPTLDHLNSAFSIPPIDLERLRKNICLALDGRKKVSIGEVIELFPCQEGFREWLAYTELFHGIPGCEIDFETIEKIQIQRAGKSNPEIWLVPTVSIPAEFSWRNK